MLVERVRFLPSFQVLCLQEVQENHYQEQLEPAFKEMGMSCFCVCTSSSWDWPSSTSRLSSSEHLLWRELFLFVGWVLALLLNCLPRPIGFLL